MLRETIDGARVKVRLLFTKLVQILLWVIEREIPYSYMTMQALENRASRINDACSWENALGGSVRAAAALHQFRFRIALEFVVKLSSE